MASVETPDESRWVGHYLYGDNYFDPKNDPPLLVIYVTEPLKEGSGLSAHTTYLITTTVFSTKKSYCCRRRYNEFKKLFEELTKLRGVNLSAFPKKKLKKFDDDIVEERRLSFEIILREMADHHQIVIAPSFRKFIEVPLSVNVFPSDFNINSYTSRRRSIITPRDQPKHHSISKKAPPPPLPSSSQSSVNQLSKEQMVNIQIPPPPPPEQTESVGTVNNPPESEQQDPPVKTISPVTLFLQEQSVSRALSQSSHQPPPLQEQSVEIEDPHTPVIILQPTVAHQTIDVSTFIEEMRLQQQSRKSTAKSPLSPVSEPVQEFNDNNVVEVRQAPQPPQRKSQEHCTTLPHNEFKTITEYDTSISEAEAIDRYNSNCFRPMVEEDEAVDQNEQSADFNLAMLNLGSQPIKVQTRMSNGGLHTPYHQIKRDSVSSKLAEMNPEERVQEILRQIKGESDV